MPLTTTQAEDRYIINSLANYLDRKVKQYYDPLAAATSSAPAPQDRFVNPITIREASPDDDTIVVAAPSIGISTAASSEKDRFAEIGTSLSWRHMSFVLACYPSLDANGAPCSIADKLLRACLRRGLATETMKILDQSNVLFSPTNIIYCNEVMYLATPGAPIPRSMTTSLAQEKHRFDYHLGVRYAVQEDIVADS